MNEKQFITKSYSKGELAQIYCPNVGLSSALKNLKKWMRIHPSLYPELETLGFDSKTRILSPKMVEVIIKHLGHPNGRLLIK